MKIRSNNIRSLFLLALLFCACASPDGREKEAGGEKGEAQKGELRPVPKRVMLVGVQTMDSTQVVTPAVVDRMLAQAFDSLGVTEYVPMERRADVPASEGDSTIPVAKLADALKLDGVLSLRVARFGSVLGVDMGIYEPRNGKTVFRDRAFSFIRYRDKDGTKLLGPALYEALDRLLHRLAKRPDSERLVVSAQPILISNVVIDRDTALGKITTNREKISTDGVRALGDFMRLKYPELVVFDYESRSRVYETVGVTLVEDHAAVNDLERNAMFNLDLPYYLTTGFYSAPGDSVEIRAEVRYLLSPRNDSLVVAESRRFPRRQFESSTLVKDAVTQLLEVVDDVLRRHADGLRSDYQSSITPGR